MRGADGVKAQQDSEEDDAWKTELRELGHSEAAIAEAFAARDASSGEFSSASSVLEIWPACWPVVEAFCALETQWHFHPTLGTHTGLDWLSVDRIVRDMKIRPRRQARADLRLMEVAALDEMRRLAREMRVREAGTAVAM